jgi:hypothetical protein
MLPKVMLAALPVGMSMTTPIHSPRRTTSRGPSGASRIFWPLTNEPLRLSMSRTMVSGPLQ